MSTAPFLSLMLGLGLAACAKTSESGPAPEAPSAEVEVEAEPELEVGPVIASGIASRYADSLAGNKTASGEPYDPAKMTCAHRKLPLGTKLQVRRKKTGDTIVCTVNDRGPFHEKRIIDLSRAAAEALGFTGVTQVEMRKVLSAPEGGATAPGSGR